MGGTQAGSEIGILKSVWTRAGDGRWAIHDIKGITLKPRPGFDVDFFAFDSEMQLLSTRPPQNLHDMFASFGPTDFLMKQSILPVVAWTEGAAAIRCIGTAFVVSCTGYVVTACHVLLDPQERGYGKIKTNDGSLEVDDGLSMGVLMPTSPATGLKGFYFLPFQRAWYWGLWHE